MNKYLVKKIDEKYADSSAVWNKISPLNIDNYPWDTNKYKPKVEVKFFWSEKSFHLFFKVFETDVKATFLNMNDDVFRDSCVEFFFCPDPFKDKRYFNFEMNAIGTLLLGLGADRQSRTRLKGESLEQFKIKTSLNRKNINQPVKEFWTVEYTIPFEFIKKYYPKAELKSKQAMAGNFYKCGDDTKFPHYGSWNPIKTPSPDFHRPEFFGELVLE